jgi:hypothetical protein
VLVDLRTPAKTKTAMGGLYPFIAIMLTTSYVNSHKSTVQKLVNAYVRTLKWIHTHTAVQIAAKLPVDYYPRNKSLYLATLKAQLPVFSPDSMMPKGASSGMRKNCHLCRAHSRAAGCLHFHAHPCSHLLCRVELDLHRLLERPRLIRLTCRRSMVL